MDVRKEVQQAHRARFICRCQSRPKSLTTFFRILRRVLLVASAWPFTCWVLDLVGTITHLSFDGHKWIITPTDYFTKWVEAVPLVSTTGVQVSKFILYHIVCRFDIPSTIFTDHRGNFENLNMEELCTSLHMHHHFSSPYFPQGNGQAEATNKTLLKILKKVVNDFGRDWHLQINLALWAY